MDQHELYHLVRSRIEAALEKAGSNPKRASLRIKERNGTSETLIRDILKGKTKNPTVETLRLIAEEAGLPLAYFVGGDEQQPAAPELPVPSETQLAEALHALLEEFPGLAHADAADLQSAAKVLRAFLARYAKNPGGFAAPDHSRTTVGAMSSLSHHRAATG